MRHTVKIEVTNQERDHKYTCGTDGTVADEITIKIKFDEKLDVQTHVSFYEELMRVVQEHIDAEIDAYTDNHE